MIQVTIMFTNHNPNTIWNKLKAKLGREPTHAEACAEVSRIKNDALVDKDEHGHETDHSGG